MSENSLEKRPGHQSGLIPEAQRQALHVKESICDELAKLADAVGVTDYAGEINRLCSAYSASESVPPEYAELLDKRFTQALEAAKAGEANHNARIQQKDKLAAEVDALIAAGELATLKEIESLEKRIADSFPGAGIETPLQPLKERLAAEAKAQQELFDKVQALADELTALTAAEDITALHDRKGGIEAEFAAISGAPRQAVHHYNEAHRKASVKLAQHYETLDLARWESYTLKLDICAELEKLCALPAAEVGKVAGRLNEIREKWKQLGSVPKEKNEEINPRYLELTRNLQHRIEEYYACKRQEQRIAAAEKQKLCEAAEALAESTDWAAGSNSFKELQNQWKTLPRAGSKEGELFARFRAAADKFFSARKVVYDERDRQYNLAAQRKKAIIAEALALTDIRRAKQLREEYRNAGSAGREEKALYQEFNGAMNNFFNSKREESVAREKRARELIAEIDSLCADAAQNRARAAEIRNELHEIACRETRVDEQQVLRRFDAECAKAAKVERERRIRESGDVLLQLAGCYSAFKNGEAVNVPDAETFAGFPKLQSAALLLAQAVGGDEKASAKLEKHVAQAQSERESICKELEKLSGMGAEEPAELSLAQELEAAIMGNFAAKEAAAGRKSADPQKLLADFAACGLVSAEDIAGFQKRIDAASAIIFKS